MYFIEWTCHCQKHSLFCDNFLEEFSKGGPSEEEKEEDKGKTNEEEKADREVEG